MADGVNYDVNAYLRTSGSFTREASMAATAADGLGSAWGRMSDRMVGAGERVRGTFGSLAADFAKGGAVAIGGSLVAGIGMAAGKGVEFNNMMEAGALGLATMYQTFGVNPAFDKNIELAKAMQHELVAIADASPGTTADIMEAYQALAPGVTGVTQDLMRQRDLMEKIAVLGFATGNDYKQLGMDVGRIVSGVAGADVATFRTLGPVLKKAFEEVTGQDVAGDFAQQFNALAKQDGELALQIFEKSVESMGGEANAAFGASFGGVLASFESKLLKLAGDFGKPLFDSIRGVLNEDVMDGVFGDKGFGKLREVAFFAGDLIASGFARGAKLTIGAVDYIATNWETIAAKIQQAGALAGVAIKTAITVGMTRTVVGSAIIAAGKIAGAFETAKQVGGPIGAMIGAQMRKTHMGIARGMKGGGAGASGMIGRGLGSAFGKLDGKGAMGIFRGFDKGILKVATMVTVVGTLGAVVGGAVMVIGALGVAVAGVSAYFVSRWDEISGALVQGLQSGSISLQPLLISAYTLWARLQLVGEAIVGTTTAAGAANGTVGFLATAIDVVTATMGPFITTLAIMVGAWGTMKVALIGVMGIIFGFVQLGNTLGAVSDETLARAQGNLNAFSKGIDDTFENSRQLFAAGEAIGNAELSPLDYDKAKAKAKELEQSLSDAIAGVGGGATGDGKGGRAKRPSVKIDKVVVEVKVDDPDPDRIFGAFLPKMMSLADKRVQAFDTMDVGG